MTEPSLVMKWPTMWNPDPRQRQRAERVGRAVERAFPEALGGCSVVPLAGGRTQLEWRVLPGASVDASEAARVVDGAGAGAVTRMPTDGRGQRLVVTVATPGGRRVWVGVSLLVVGLALVLTA